MKKSLFLLLLGVIFMSAQVVAQMSVSGTVSDEDGPLIGVNIVEKGTQNGTVTDLDGNFAISVAEGATLVFSYVGYENVEMAAAPTLTVLMQESGILDEVVVTALGISREEKSLGYATETFATEELTKSTNTSAVNALVGKVSGLDIQSTGGDPGKSTKLIIRGIGSLSGSSSPLLIVDGVPVRNSSSVGTSLNGAFDFGSEINSINPNDIEDVTVLKGVAATTLYGTDASNGAIVITTKSGASKENKKWNIDVNSTTSFSRVGRLPNLQSQFGSGWQGGQDPLENTSWGPAFDGKPRAYGHIADVDGDGAVEQLITEYSAKENNIKDFYDTGFMLNNGISISKGGDLGNFKLSYANTYNNGIVPDDNDVYKRNNVGLRAGVNVTDKFKLSAGFNMNIETFNQDPTGQGLTSINSLYQIPRNVSIVDLSDLSNPFNTADYYFSNYGIMNPYLALENREFEFTRRKMFGFAQADFKMTDWLSGLYRLGYDFTNGELFNRTAAVRPSEDSPNASVFTSETGAVTEQRLNNSVLDHVAMVKADKTFADKYNINGFVGFNANQVRTNSLSSSVTNLDIPGFFNLSNSGTTPSTSTNRTVARKLGVFGEVGFGYDRWAFITYTWRNDWSSTLPTENRSFFYNSISGSIVFSELLPSNKVLSFGKVRASFGTGGNDAAPHNPYIPRFIPGSTDQPFGDLSFPFGGLNGFEVSNVIADPNLQPEFAKEYEFGLELGFLKNRINISSTYYNRLDDKQIFALSLDPATGVTSRITNSGAVRNKGVELTAEFVPVKTKDFNWSLNFNFTKNWNEVESLPEGLDEITIGGISGVGYVARAGMPYGLYEVTVPQRNEDGQIVVNSNGLPIASPTDSIFGSSQRDWIAGGRTQFSWKGLTIGASADIKWGGLIFSRTADISIFAASSDVTLYNDRNPFIIPNSVQEDGEGGYIENTEPVDFNEITNYFNDDLISNPLSVFDKSFIRLRELYVSYTLPSKLFKNNLLEYITLGFVANNVALWTPSENRWIDPEVSTFGTGNDSEFGEFSSNPNTRTYGFKLNVGF